MVRRFAGVDECIRPCPLSGINATEEHYARLLGLESPWKVTRVKLSVEKMRVDIFIEYGKKTLFPCRSAPAYSAFALVVCMRSPFVVVNKGYSALDQGLFQRTSLWLSVLDLRPEAERGSAIAGQRSGNSDIK